jgi:hypothetical protein
MQLQSRLHLRQVGWSGNITSFSRRDKVFVPAHAQAMAEKIAFS